MKNLALMWVLAGVALLSASLYVYSENIDSADADYCLALGTDPKFLLVKQNNDLIVRTGKKPIVCKSPYRGYGVNAKIDFIDKSGKRIILLTGSYGTGWGCSDCYETGPYLLPRKLQIFELPNSISQHIIRTMSQEEKNNKFKDLLQFKDKIIVGYIEMFPDCEPHKLSYKTKFRVRITGECGCDSIKERRK